MDYWMVIIAVLRFLGKIIPRVIDALEDGRIDNKEVLDIISGAFESGVDKAAKLNKGE